ncbi:unnamed protein product, partial [Trichogramma brassicae]
MRPPSYLISSIGRCTISSATGDFTTTSTTTAADVVVLPLLGDQRVFSSSSRWKYTSAPRGVRQIIIGRRCISASCIYQTRYTRAYTSLAPPPPPPPPPAVPAAPPPPLPPGATAATSDTLCINCEDRCVFCAAVRAQALSRRLARAPLARRAHSSPDAF